MAERIPVSKKKEVDQEIDKTERISRTTRGVRRYAFIYSKNSF